MNKQQNSLLILHFWNNNRKCLIVGHRQENIYWNYTWDRYAFHFSKFVAFLYLAMNTNDTLRGFFYHLFSVFYAFQLFAVCFVVTLILEGFNTKTFQFLKMIHSGYSISYFNLFLIYAVTCYSPVAGESNS